MDESKKVAPAATEATGKARTVSDEQCNQQQCHVVELSDTAKLRVHATFEAALQESQTRVQR